MEDNDVDVCTFLRICYIYMLLHDASCILRTESLKSTLRLDRILCFSLGHAWNAIHSSK
jgi:hypothetical protein